MSTARESGNFKASSFNDVVIEYVADEFLGQALDDQALDSQALDGQALIELAAA
jgi:hypothetical protein